ncbi:MAG: pirin family protein [Gammaproteobacteria bacterium]|nr:pirin family protein [Gammaproteobacteria bacterium]
MRRILGIHRPGPFHWVGDGFPVKTVFSYDNFGQQLSPFLLLDHAEPRHFEPAGKPRGVGEHPHRGFETVTIVYAGEVEHRDSAGGGGRIGPGDVQWMTAAGGLVHEEFHSRDFTARGGLMEMAQLWVNLPARDKLAEPRYQTVVARDIPVVQLPGESGQVRVIAGDYAGHSGPAQTFTPINVWDLRLKAGHSAPLDVPEGHNAVLVPLDNTVRVNGTEDVPASRYVVFGQTGGGITVEAQGEDVKALLLTGVPLNEPIAGYGPFVMNTEDEIRQAFVDYREGRFGTMPVRELA